MTESICPPDPNTASNLRRWEPRASSSTSSVETLTIRKGFYMVLSRVAGQDCEFYYEEPDDVFGIGFHLRGGSRFKMERKAFVTQPLEVWAGAAPRGSTSTFRLPAYGFLTVSLRFEPDAIRELLDHQGREAVGTLDEMARRASTEVSTARLDCLSDASAVLVNQMFTTPFTGSARMLFLESCALGLLASQVDAASRTNLSPRDILDDKRMEDARDWLDAHLDAPPSIVQLARIVGVNDFKLKRSFKARFGTTIFGYIRQRRMERAAAQLHAGLSVAEAATEVGYACPRSFSDAFRRHFNTLPSNVARAKMADIPPRHT